MPVVSLTLAKLHMNVTHDAHDELIGLYIGAAERWIEHYIAKKLADFDPVPDDLQVAVLQLVALRYVFREAAALGSTPIVPPFDVISTLKSYNEHPFDVPQEAENAG